jgi:hypothetical protein
VLHTHPEFHSSITSNATAIKATLKAWQANLSECEIAMHSRPVVDLLVAETYDPLFDKSTSLVKPLDSMQADPRVHAKHGSIARKNSTHERYYHIREKERFTHKSYLDAITVRGASAAIEHLDQQHVFSRMYAEATAMQKASFKTKRKVTPKDGKGLGSTWAGANGPHLAPGTYHTDAGLIQGRIDKNEVPLTANAAFHDTRKSGRDEFLKLTTDETSDDVVTNPFSKRSAVSTINARGILNRHKNVWSMDIEKSLPRGVGMYKDIGSTYTPTQFLDKVNARELRSKPKDFTHGVLPLVYSNPGLYAAEVASRPVTAPEDEEKNKQTHKAKRGVLSLEEEDSVVAPSLTGMTDKSLKGTAKFIREWKKKNNISSRPATSGSGRRYRD